MSLEHRVAIGAAFSDAHESKMPTEGKHTFEVLLDGVNHYVTGTVSFRRGPHQCALEVESVKPHDEQASAADLAPENNSEAPVADPAPENTTAAPAPDPAPENNSEAPVADPAPENTTAAPAPDPAPENNSGAEA